MNRELFSPLAVSLGVLGLAGVLATWWVMVRSWPLLPATVACHFDFLGRPDSLGSKGCLWFLAVLAAVLYVALGVLGLWGASGGGDTSEGTRRTLEFLMGGTAYLAWMNFFLIHRIIGLAMGRRKDLGRWFLPAILGVLAVLILVGSLRLR